MPRLDLESIRPQINAFCTQWKIDELSIFGSAIRDDFNLANSDVDVLINFAGDARWSLYDWIDMRDELQRMFERPVDLVSKKGLRNPFRRKSILHSRQVIYAA